MENPKLIKNFLNICSGYGSGSRDINNPYYNFIRQINGHKIYRIDTIPVIIHKIRNNIAKCEIVNKDLTFTPCFIIKRNNLFAHGKTMKDARTNLNNKIICQQDIEKKIDTFTQRFKKNAKYTGKEFYTWHHLLTGSCQMGRDNFVKNNAINLNKKYSVEEFIKICENDYGGEIIRRLKPYYFEDSNDTK